jgi:hypothetical protein
MLGMRAFRKGLERLVNPGVCKNLPPAMRVEREKIKRANRLDGLYARRPVGKSA